VIAPATLVTGLLFYFGFARTRAQGAYFGIDTSVLGFSSQDYLLRSVDTTFWPVSMILLLSLGAGLLHSAANRWIETVRAPGRALRLGLALAAAGLLSFGFGLLNILWRPVVSADRVFLVPMTLVLGVSAASYGGYLAVRARWAMSASSSSPPVHHRPSRFHVGVLATLVILGLFWTVGDYADGVGRQRARSLAMNLSVLPSVVVYSRSPLFLDGPGIEVRTLGRGRDRLYRYSGLRLLIHAQDKYFLLPEGWTAQSGQAIVLPDAEAVRFDFSAR